MTLSPKERRFVDAYLVNPVAKEAAIAAGYSAKTAKQIGHMVVRRPHVAAAIEAAQQRLSVRAEVTVDRIVARLDGIAVDPKAATRDKIRANELLGRHLGMFVERHEHSGPDGSPIPTNISVTLVSPTRASDG